MISMYSKRWRMFHHKYKQLYKAINSPFSRKTRFKINNCMNSNRWGKAKPKITE